MPTAHLPQVLPWRLRSPVFAAVALLALAGCTALQRAPGGVRPTLEALMGLGLRCDGGEADHVPSGLFQWHCRGSGAWEGRSVLVNGNDAGVASLYVVAPTDDTGTAREWVRSVVEVTPPLTRLDGLAAEIDGALAPWDGRPLIIDLRGLGFGGECIPPSQFGDGQCVVIISGPDPIRPMLP